MLKPAEEDSSRSRSAAGEAEDCFLHTLETSVTGLYLPASGPVKNQLVVTIELAVVESSPAQITDMRQSFHPSIRPPALEK